MRATVTAFLLCVLVGTACTAPRPTPVAGSPEASSTPTSGSIPTAAGTVPPAITATPGPPGTAPPDSGEPTIGPTAPPEPTESPTAPPEPTAPPPEPTITPGGYVSSRVLLVLEPVVAFGLSQPVYITHAGDQSHLLYVVEKRGRIRVLLPDGTVRRQPFLDITDRVSADGERGLYAVAFHPDFESNGRFFVHWTNAQDQSSVEEYTAEGDGEVSIDTARTVLQVDFPGTTNKGGWLGFGPDGFLYIALGDGGGLPPGDPHRNGQDTTKLFGKILRIDVDGEEPYAIPPDNPFAGATGGERPEIWAYGLRNPWRASFDRRSGDLWIGDVSQSRAEEVNVIPTGQGGLNFGWSDMEGTRCHRKRNCDPSAYVLPAATYPSGPHGYCAITGGYVYRGATYPFMDGGYVYTDQCNSNVFGFDAAGAMAGEDVGRGRKLAPTGYKLLSLGEDEDGELYAVDLDGGIFRLIPVQLQ